jgi:deazaflavin-dependent oxidoreductase (nitroreductase family)
MKAVDLITRFATTRFGMAVDRGCVRWSGHSIVGLLFSRLTHAAYNKPLLLTTIGGKTGRRRTVVLPFFIVGDQMAVVGSRGGMPTDPHWVTNLRANPQAWIRIDRKLQPVTAHIALGAEREPLWTPITRQAAVYLEYQRRATTREIPVVVLTPDASRRT